MAPIKGTIKCSRPKTPLPRTWFLARGYKKADPDLMNGTTVYIHPVTNDALSAYGTKLSLTRAGQSKQYLKFSRTCGNKLLTEVKYRTFVGDIPKGYQIDHIDGNTLNNSIRNLRAVPPSINRRDGGFMRKLRNNGFIVAMFPGIILAGYKRMAEWKDEHTLYAYNQLKGKELLQVFVGPHFRIEDIDTLMSREMSHHCEI